MKFNINLNYHSYYKKPKKASWESVVMQMPFTGVVKDVDKSDVELAFRIGEQSLQELSLDETENQKILASHLEPFRCRTQPLNVLFFENNYYAERFRAEDAELEFGKAGIGSWSAIGTSPLLGHARINHPEIDEAGSKQFGWFDTAAPADKSEALQKLKLDEVKRWTPLDHLASQMANQVLETFICVEGVIYEKVAEPVLVIYEDGKDAKIVLEEHAPLPRLNTSVNRGSKDTNLRYGVDQIDDAHHAAKLLASRLGGTVKDSTIIDFVNPAFVRFRGETTSLHAFAKLAADYFQYGDRYDHSFNADVFDKLKQEAALAVYDLCRSVGQGPVMTPEAVAACRALTGIYKRAKGAFDIYDKNLFESYYQRLVEQFYDRFEEITRGLDLRLALYDRKSESSLDWHRYVVDSAPVFNDNECCHEISNWYEANHLEKQLGINLKNYIRQAGNGEGRIVTITDFEARKVSAAGFISESGSVTIWSQPHLDRDEEFQAMVDTYMSNAKRSRVEYEDELDELGL